MSVSVARRLTNVVPIGTTIFKLFRALALI